jgi:hypothetical protein
MGERGSGIVQLEPVVWGSDIRDNECEFLFGMGRRRRISHTSGCLATFGIRLRRFFHGNDKKKGREKE